MWDVRWTNKRDDAVSNTLKRQRTKRSRDANNARWTASTRKRSKYSGDSQQTYCNALVGQKKRYQINTSDPNIAFGMGKEH